MSKPKNKKRIPILPLSLIALVLAAIFIVSCWIKNIDTPYYTQDTSYYCGAASAQMILDSEEIGIYVDQATLYSYIHSHNQCSGWATDPKGLRDVLNHYSSYFIYYTPTSQENGVKKLAYTIDKYGVPPSCLIYGCQHWVVVRGVFTDVQPTTASSYTIYGFFVNDPWYGSDTLGENKYIDIDTWKDDYFIGCSWCGASGTTFISVVDPDPLQVVRIEYPQIMARKPKIISESEARMHAEKYLRSFKSQEIFRKHFKEAFDHIETAIVGSPLLVKRTDREKSAYYIIPLQRDEMTSGAMIIDAYSGQYKEASYVKKPIKYVPELQEKRAIELFRKKLPHLIVKKADIKEKFLKPIRITPKDVKIVTMERVWEPSIQTQNPYYPMWKAVGMVKDMKKPATLGYMDFKGRVLNKIVKSRIKGGGGLK